MIFKIANQIIKLTFGSINNNDNEILKKVAARYAAPEAINLDFEIFIIFKSNLEDKLYKIPNGPVRLNSNPTNTTTVISSNKFISHISWLEKLMTVSLEANCTYSDLLILENIKLLIALLCLHKGGLPCHSSTLYKNDRAIAFMGNSGSGKSTIATILSTSWNLIDDDFNIFLPENKAFYAHTTPFYVLKGTQEIYPKSPPIQLKRIFILKKGMVTKISPLSSQEKYIIMMGNTFAFPMSDHFAQIILANCQSMCETVPIFNLFFTKTDDINRKLDSFLRGNDQL
jgi:hypothetical protein